MTSNEPEWLEPTELLDRLMIDKNGVVRDQAVARLGELELELKTTLEDGVAPSEYQALSKARTALGEAADVVEGVWTLIHDLKKEK